MVAAAGHLRKRGGFWTEHMFCKELCDMAECVMPNTADELEMLARGFGVRREAMIEIPNGVEERFYHATPELFVREFGLRDFVLYVGHIGWARKNVLPLIRALMELRLPAVLIGPVVKNDYALRCQRLVDTVSHIRMIPGLPAGSPLLESAYAACDTLVLPAMYETPGIAALEAGLAGAKVCITQFGGTREYFGGDAEYLDPRSVSSIAAAITRSVSKRKGTVLRERIRGSYLWSHAGRRLSEAYARLQPAAKGRGLEAGEAKP
jgi:glycosyltransferase involved in cell wall biosynthesis